MNSFDTNADLHMNPKTNLLEQAEFNYILQDVEQPNLYRQNFKYDEVPKIVFNRRLVPMEMPGEIWITDTTFRDGQQSREPVSYTHLDVYKRQTEPRAILTVPRL